MLTVGVSCRETDILSLGSSESKKKPMSREGTRRRGPRTVLLIPLLAVAVVSAFQGCLGETSERGVADGHILGRVRQLQAELQSKVQVAASGILHPEAGVMDQAVTLGQGLGLDLDGLGGDGTLTSPEERQRMAAFLKRHFSFPGARTCGWWANGYATLHQRIRQGVAPPKYLTYTPFEQQGLGDRLLGLVSTFLTALVTDRALIIDDPVLSQAFQPSQVDWRIGPDVDLKVTTRNLLNVSEGAVLQLSLQNRVPWLAGPTVRYPSDLVEFGRRFEAARNVLLETNGGVAASIFSQRGGRTFKALSALGMQLRTAYPCALRFLLRPLPEVGALMRRSFSRLHASGDPHSSSSICIHMRVPDAYTWRPDGQPIQRSQVKGWIRQAQKQLFYCAERVMRRNHLPSGTTKWLFMSESLPLRHVARKDHPRFVVLSSTRPLHPGIANQTAEQKVLAMRSTTADWLLFSTCKYYVIVNSGFCKTALAYSTTAKAAFLFRRPNGWTFSGNCDPRRPDNLTSLGSSWSGL